MGIVNFLVAFIITSSIYAIFCMALNVHWGYTGLLNYGIAGFFAIGAYTSALFTTKIATGEVGQYMTQLFGFGLPVIFGIIAAGIVAGIVAIAVGFLTLRLKEGYLAIATIGIAETIRLFIQNEAWLANGTRGIIGIPIAGQRILEFFNIPISWYGKYYNYFYLIIVLLFLGLVYLALEKGIRSPWGRVLKAIREDEIMANADGKNVFKFKMQSLVLGAVIMGIGGALYAHFARSIQTSAFEPLFGTFLIWAMLTLGGTGNNKGAILGAFIVWALWSWSKFFISAIVPAAFATRAPYIRYFLIGAMLAGIVVLRPRGLLGEEKHVSKGAED